MKKFVKVILVVGVIVLIFIVMGIINFVKSLKVEEIKKDYKIGQWYKITPEGAVDSLGKDWHGLMKLGKENKVVINFYGGGVSINEDTAKEGEDFYFHSIGDKDFSQLIGISSNDKNNPLKDWTFINIPYCTGDWHIGTNDFEYTDKDGNRQILHHSGYTNFELMMKEVLKYVDNPDAVLVTGWSGGGFGASFLANEIFSKYYPNAKNKNVLIDGAFLLKDDWKDIASNVWKTPDEIANRFISNNLVLDSLQALSKDHSDVKIMYLCSIRDAELVKYQSYLDDGSFEATSEKGKKFEHNLKGMVDELLKLPNTSVFIWNDKNNDTELTGHTVTMLDFVNAKYNGVKVSDWVMNTINDKTENCGLDLFK